MKKFLAVYTGSKNGQARKKWDELDVETRKKREQEGMVQWGNWAKEHAKAIVDQGSPLGKTKKIDPNGISDITNNLAAFTVVQAESYEAAAKIFLNHPHFTIFPGEAVEIMEFLPIPTR